MNLSLFGSLFGSKSQESAAPQPLREAYGATIDPDEEQWRKLTGDSNRDLSPLTQSRMQKIAVWLWESNQIGNRLIELPLAYLLAEGVSLESDDAETQKALNRFWADPINAMDLHLPEHVRELAMYGEQCWPAFVNEHDGHVRLGYLDPALIATVVKDPDNSKQPIGVITQKNTRGVARRYRVIINGPESVFSDRTQLIRETFTDGECFYFAINRLSNGARGRSDLLAQADWLDGYDQFLFGELDRSSFMRAFLWDVTLKGATPIEVEERARKIGAPAPGSVRVHNDSEVWDAVTPDLKAADSSEIARLFRNHVLGGGTIPEHWLGGGGDVNRATGESMSEPTFKIFSMRQRTLKHILETVGCYVARRRIDPTGEQDIEYDDPRLAVSAVFPEMTARDTTRYAAALQQVVMAVRFAIEAQLMTRDTGMRLVQSIAERLGVEMDVEQELKDTAIAASQRAEEDVFVDLPE